VSRMAVCVNTCQPVTFTCNSLVVFYQAFNEAKHVYIAPGILSESKVHMNLFTLFMCAVETVKWSLAHTQCISRQCSLFNVTITSVPCFYCKCIGLIILFITNKLK